MGWDNGATQSVLLMLPAIPGAVLPSGATAPLAGALCAARPPLPRAAPHGSVGKAKRSVSLQVRAGKKARK